MALSKMEDIRKLSAEEVTEEIAKIKRELFELRFQKATRQMETGFHQFKHARHRLAQLMTVEREQQLASANSSDGE
ncbi:MAG: 50S ribosomal protein L29 [Leptolyngbya sp. SIO4C1]|nr:50S ribosomal protein L29 [Leptolyngbya sp. SIO4C1]